MDAHDKMKAGHLVKITAKRINHYGEAGTIITVSEVPGALYVYFGGINRTLLVHKNNLKRIA